MKNINLSVDGGGTSLRIIAFDDGLNLTAQSKSGSVNPNFESGKKIGENISEAVNLLLKNLNRDFKIKNIYETIVGSVNFFNETLTRESGGLTKDAIFHVISEGHSHLYAASLRNKGGVALAGTGSGAIYCNKGGMIHIGGYGIPVGDEGSGAWIGIQGMSAAVKYISGWGEKTLLTEKLYKYLNIKTPDLITNKLYGKDVNQRILFAGFCPYVAECERTGDKLAKDIIYSAGRDMGLQMISVLKRAESKKMINDGTKNPVIYASGGAWKGTPYMLEAMTETICGVYRGAICAHGLFDPVMGGVIKFIFDKTEEYTISAQYEEHLKIEFKDYLFKFDDF
ncbi:MAG: hypothetical protein FWD71_14060 [Oscillospiraceae bacterium]|nr:hypothetical protein [Oscillospiraceae bacterium]